MTASNVRSGNSALSARATLSACWAIQVVGITKRDMFGTFGYLLAYVCQHNIHRHGAETAQYRYYRAMPTQVFAAPGTHDAFASGRVP